MSDTDVRHDRERGQAGGSDGNDGERIDARGAADRAFSYMEEMTGQQPEIVIAVEPDDDRWLVQIELLELARVPETTDVLGCYEVEISYEGEPLAYRRTRRYHRGRVGEQ